MVELLINNINFYKFYESMSDKSEDCLQCRLTSGGGLLGMSAYVVHQSKKVKTSSRHFITALGYALGIFGILRIFAFPPFKSRSQKENKIDINESEGNEYIIGKIPPKFQ